jgi:hypothetical protein
MTRTHHCMQATVRWVPYWTRGSRACSSDIGSLDHKKPLAEKTFGTFEVDLASIHEI